MATFHSFSRVPFHELYTRIWELSVEPHAVRVRQIIQNVFNYSNLFDTTVDTYARLLQESETVAEKSSTRYII